MTAAEGAALNTALRRWLPRLAASPALRVATLGGLSNRSFHVWADGAAGVDGDGYALRLPGPGSTAGGVDRRREARYERRAERLGLTPPLVAIDPASGVKISRFVPGARALDAAALRRPGVLYRALALLRRAHRGPGNAAVGGDMPLAPLTVLDALLRRSPLPTAERLRLGALRTRLRRRAGPAPRAARYGPGRGRPCHGDPSPENFLDAGRLYLIDWEYAGRGAPLWDLAALTVEAEMSERCALRALRRYLLATPAPGLCARLRWYRAALALIAAAWARGDGCAARAYRRRRRRLARRLLG